MRANEKKPGKLEPRDVRRRFDRVAGGFARADFVHRFAAEGMLERMSPMLLDAGHVVDAGAAHGAASRALAKRFRGSRVFSLDRSLPMLTQARKARSRLSRVREIQADAAQLPFKTSSIDLVFANMLLPWIADTGTFFAATARVLKPGGLFVFSSLGPDSLAELREAWRAVDADEHVMTFADMHEVGDAMVHAGLEDPVLDVDHLTVTYDDLPSLFADLTATGGRNALSGRRRSLTGRGSFDRLRQNLERRFGGNRLEFPLELVFGHAWGGGPPMPPGEYAFDARRIGRRRR